MAQRFYRRLWSWSANRAKVTIAISEKTRVETAEFASRARTVVVPNGSNHPSRWARPDREPAEKLLVTFGHHANKRPDLVVRALAEIHRSHTPNLRLVVLGARAERANAIRELALSLDVDALVDLPGYVPDAQYQQIIQTSSCVVLASTDEGFGLPVVEAAYFGIPVVTTHDSGLLQIHPDLVLASDPTPEALGAAINSALSASSIPRVLPTWQGTAGGIRAAVESPSALHRMHRRS